jgi:hypothetical protein
MLKPPPFVILTKGGIADSDNESKDRIEALKKVFKDPNAKILLHLHGGLIDEEAGLEIARKLSGDKAPCWNLGDDWTQVYVVWRTGVFETIETNWTELAKSDRLYQAILKRLLSFVARKLVLPTAGGRSMADEFSLTDEAIQNFIIGEAPDPGLERAEAPLDPKASARQRALVLQDELSEDLALEFRGELEIDNDYQDALENIEGFANEQAVGRGPAPAGQRELGELSLKHLDDEIRGEYDLEADGRVPSGRGPVSVGLFFLEHAYHIALRCFERFRNHRDHGLHATVVEEICRELYGDFVGGAIWGFMVQDAADHFSAGGFGKTLVDAMAGSKARLVVTAHSAGSIWATQLLMAAAKAGLNNTIDLYLLAPAVRHSLFRQMLDEAEPLIDHCAMFTMDDEHERLDPVLGDAKKFIYPSSLLYVVSGLFEERAADAYVDAPILGMQRFLTSSHLDETELEDAKMIREFFEAANRDIFYSPSPDVTGSLSHGGFDDDLATLASVRARLIG